MQDTDVIKTVTKVETAPVNMKIRTTLTFHETIKVNDMYREMQSSNTSITFREVKSIFFKQRHLKDIEKAKKDSRKVRAVEKKSRTRKTS